MAEPNNSSGGALQLALWLALLKETEATSTGKLAHTSRFNREVGQESSRVTEACSSPKASFPIAPSASCFDESKEAIAIPVLCSDIEALHEQLKTIFAAERWVGINQADGSAKALRVETILADVLPGAGLGAEHLPAGLVVFFVSLFSDLIAALTGEVEQTTLTMGNESFPFKMGEFSSRRSSMRPPTSDNVESVEMESQSQAQSESQSIQYTAAQSQTSLISTARRQTFVGDIKHQVMVNFLHQQQCSKLWISDLNGLHEGVLLRKQRGEYLAFPPELEYSQLAAAVNAMNVQVAMTVRSGVIDTILDWSQECIYVPLKTGQQIQILPCISDLPKARKHQYAAFVAEESLLVVWDDDAMNIVSRAANLEAELMGLVWSNGNSEKDPEAQAPTSTSTRPTLLLNAFTVAATLTLVFTFCGLTFRQITFQYLLDKSWYHFLYAIYTPAQIFFSLVRVCKMSPANWQFFAQIVVHSVVQLFGPVQQLHTNSKLFSAVPPPRKELSFYPHITIQCPVYNEGLEAVIAPTVKSLKQAISTYELQGGTANIFINDDGIQAGKLTKSEVQDRIDFYTNNNIGWTARPKHGVDGFIRRGKFKKASNLNYGLYLSNVIEEKLALIERPSTWTQDDESEKYERCCEELREEFDGKALLGGNIRIGDYILLDTEIPADCLIDAATEMEESPNVGILQFSSDIIKVVDNYFVNGITFFTKLVYTYICYGVANGDVSPFLGHNAILRWSAVQDVSFTDEDGYEKYWSESHVSEDFDMALRLQIEGYLIRLASWAGDGFKEGVSLTVYDELARWEKYSYGCNELLFWPLKYWLFKGPFTPLFRKFIFADVRFSYKVVMISYIGSYYAIGSAWILIITNYFVFGWFLGHVDHSHINSWQIFLACLIVFSVAGSVVLAVLRYRTGEKGFFASLFENCKWVVLLLIFFGGLSMHVSQAIIWHFLGINMSWGATSKELEFTNFFIEVPRVLKKFKFSFLICTTLLVGMVILGVAPFVPYQWRITEFIATFPLGMLLSSHIILPIALNPGLMTFSW